MTRAQLMSEPEIERLQEASEDVVYLTAQGTPPTDAIAKVASAAQLTKDQTNLLIHSYSASIAAEKRASAGGPFSRLGEYELPDPDKVMEIVFGKKGDTTYKEASVISCPAFASKGTTKTASSPMTFDLRHLDKDLSHMSPADVQEMFYPATKTAQSEAESAFEKMKQPGSGMARTQVMVSMPIQEKDASRGVSGCIDFIPESMEEVLNAGLKKMSSALSDQVDSILRDMIKKSDYAKTEAYAEASEAYARLGGMVTDFGGQLRRPFEDISHKAAGLASIHAFYPDVSELIRPFISEVAASQLKMAEYRVLDVSRNHEYIATAKRIHDQIEKTAELTLKANGLKEQHDGLIDFFDSRPRGTQADWLPFVPAEILSPKQAAVGLGIGSLLGYAVGSARQKKNVLNNWTTTGLQKVSPGYSGTSPAEPPTETASTIEGFPSLSSLLTSKNIGTASMLNDFAVNDEILSAYPMHDLVSAYGELAKTVPHVMRDKVLARSLLQQYMSQGRFAPTELDPALKFDDNLSRRYGVILGEGKHGSADLACVCGT